MSNSPDLVRENHTVPATLLEGFGNGRAGPFSGTPNPITRCAHTSSRSRSTTYERYKTMAPASIATYNGKYLVRGAKMITLEGGETASAEEAAG